jgi:hypothetical protein|nr:MAG TPA: hypothetical protein [Caudoviricetes sp.]
MKNGEFKIIIKKIKHTKRLNKSIMEEIYE